MAFKVEDGTGVVGANSYASVETANAYLSERARSSENSWQSQASSVKQAALIKATDYIEKRFGHRFRGQKEFTAFTEARATLTFTSNPADADTVTIGGTTYTFQTSFVDAPTNVAIDARLSNTIINLMNAVNGTGDGTGSGSAAVAIDEALAYEAYGYSILFVSRYDGPDGNTIAVSTTSSAASWSDTTFLGGSHLLQNQPLSFPRIYIYDRAGNAIEGIPAKLVDATVEYAVRSLNAELYQDPTVDPSGRSVTRLSQQVGPIRTETRYTEDGQIREITIPYPAADRLLAEFVRGTGGVIR